MKHITVKGKSVSQVVTEVMERLVVQGKRCVDPNLDYTSCLYSDGEGNHCGIGWLLNEKTCDDSMKALGNLEFLIQGHLRHEDDTLANHLSESITTYSLLQRVHDSDSGGVLKNRIQELCDSLYSTCPSFEEYSTRLNHACEGWVNTHHPR